MFRKKDSIEVIKKIHRAVIAMMAKEEKKILKGTVQDRRGQNQLKEGEGQYLGGVLVQGGGLGLGEDRVLEDAQVLGGVQAQEDVPDQEGVLDHRDVGQGQGVVVLHHRVREDQDPEIDRSGIDHPVDQLNVREKRNEKEIDENVRESQQQGEEQLSVEDHLLGEGIREEDQSVEEGANHVLDQDHMNEGEMKERKGRN